MSDNEKSAGKKLKDLLAYETKNAYDVMDDEEIQKCMDFSQGYIDFLNAAKTERECVAQMEGMLESARFKEFNPYKVPYEPGERFYLTHRDKALILGVIGEKDISSGVNVIVSHIDCPRLDLKPNPLYEDGGLAYFKTHYYGGIKKYQWTSVPLSLHGVIVTRDNEKINVLIGENENDPVFCVTDLLPHLAAKQMDQKMSQGVTGENLNILIGSRPFKEDDLSQKIKLNILSLLHEKYGIVEEDFLSAELELVPAYGAKSVGFDSSLIGAYGHDDRACAYTSLMAALSQSVPKRTSIVVFCDKEEIGSVGTTSAQSRFFENFMSDLCDMYGAQLRKVLSSSFCLSADGNAAYDPSFPEVFEKNNTAKINSGVVVTKYTGSRGKSGASDASAEVMGNLRKLFNAAGVVWQTGELGKVDEGGGGTIAMFISNLDLETVDCGTPILSMHAPFEIVSKADVYHTYRAFYEFLKSY